MQLRKQLSIRGHSIIGDNKYKISKEYINKKNNLMLHAYKIFFRVNNIKYDFSSKIPKHFQDMVKRKYLKIVGY